MGIADLFMPGQRRRALGQSIEGVVGVARSRAEADGLDESRARLWNMLCDASGQTLQQLLVKNNDRRLDWGLKKHSKRVSDPVLVVLFWWMLLYQIVLFKNRGLEGYTPDDVVDAMYEIARRFVETEFARMEVATDPPGPWSEGWRRQYPIESAMEFYNATYSMLNLKNDLSLRVEHVSHFTTLTEQAYDRLAAETVFGE
ncbi:MAG: hypothetical protein J4G14_05990 [Dehalococcoidia bacterium]|nr:hypothetical protein [Dehalococcoidia bacterium]